MAGVGFQSHARIKNVLPIIGKLFAKVLLRPHPVLFVKKLDCRFDKWHIKANILFTKAVIFQNHKREFELGSEIKLVVR